MSGLRELQLAQLAERTPALVVVDVQRDFGDPSLLGAYGLDDETVDVLELSLIHI